jgi:hypothetical protein
LGSFIVRKKKSDSCEFSTDPPKLAYSTSPFRKQTTTTPLFLFSLSLSPPSETSPFFILEKSEKNGLRRSQEVPEQTRDKFLRISGNSEEIIWVGFSLEGFTGPSAETSAHKVSASITAGELGELSVNFEARVGFSWLKIEASYGSVLEFSPEDSLKRITVKNDGNIPADLTLRIAPEEHQQFFNIVSKRELRLMPGQLSQVCVQYV